MKNKVGYIVSATLFLLFAIFTAAVLFVDVQTVEATGGNIGMATLNKSVFDLLGRSELWYDITEMLGLVSIAAAFGFALCGVVQLIKRKSVARVDRELIALGVFYVAVVAFYILFELAVVNCRPVLIDGELEASYPSSHTMLVVCIMATGISELKRLLGEKKTLRVMLEALCIVIIAVTVVGRLLSGVHWLTDIIGSLLLSSALVTLYCSVCRSLSNKE